MHSIKKLHLTQLYSTFGVQFIQQVSNKGMSYQGFRRGRKSLSFFALITIPRFIIT